MVSFALLLVSRSGMKVVMEISTPRDPGLDYPRLTSLSVFLPATPAVRRLRGPSSNTAPFSVLSVATHPPTRLEASRRKISVPAFPPANLERFQVAANPEIPAPKTAIFIIVLYVPRLNFPRTRSGNETCAASSPVIRWVVWERDYSLRLRFLVAPWLYGGNIIAS